MGQEKNVSSESLVKICIHIIVRADQVKQRKDIVLFLNILCLGIWICTIVVRTRSSEDGFSLFFVIYFPFIGIYSIRIIVWRDQVK